MLRLFASGLQALLQLLFRLLRRAGPAIGGWQSSGKNQYSTLLPLEDFAAAHRPLARRVPPAQQGQWYKPKQSLATYRGYSVGGIEVPL